METTKDQVPQDKVLTLKEIEVLKQVPLTDKELQDLVEKDEEMYGLNNPVLYSRKTARKLRNDQLKVDQRAIRRKQTVTDKNPMQNVNIGKSLVQRMNKQVQDSKEKLKSKLRLPTRKIAAMSVDEEKKWREGMMTKNWQRVNAGDRSAKLKKARQGDIVKVSNGGIVFTKKRPMVFLPRRATKYAAGYDVSPCAQRMTVLKGRKMTEMPLGWSVRMPKDCYGILALRSGFHKRHPQLTIVGGVIDSDYEGEVRMMLMNHGTDDIKLMRGFEFAQLLINKRTVLDVYERDFDNDDEEAVKRVQVFPERQDWEESKSASETMEYQFDSQQQRADIYGMETELYEIQEVSAEDMMSDQELLGAVEEYEFQEKPKSQKKKKEAPPQKWCNCDVGMQDFIHRQNGEPVCGNCDYRISPEDQDKYPFYCKCANGEGRVSMYEDEDIYCNCDTCGCPIEGPLH
jgi:dUTP pyrophosphatase